MVKLVIVTKRGNSSAILSKTKHKHRENRVIGAFPDYNRNSSEVSILFLPVRGTNGWMCRD